MRAQKLQLIWLILTALLCQQSYAELPKATLIIIRTPNSLDVPWDEEVERSGCPGWILWGSETKETKHLSALLNGSRRTTSSLYNLFYQSKINVDEIDVSEDKIKLSALPRLNAETIVLIVYPAQSGDHFTRCLFLGKNWPPGGFYSSTTRWSCLAAETDVMPTLLSELKFSSAMNITIEHREINGNRLTSSLNGWIIFQHTDAISLLLAIGLLAGVWFLLTLYYIKKFNSILTIQRVQMAFWTAIPLGMTAAGYLPHPSKSTYFCVMLLTAFFVMAASVIFHRISAMTLLTISAAISLTLLVIDALLGLQGANHSLFGLYLFSGARIYGLDNDQLGYVAALTIMFSDGFLKSRNPKPISWHFLLVIALFIAIAFVMGLPNLGANAGGFAACIAGFLALSWLCLGKKMNFILAIISVLAGIISTFGLGFWENAKSSSQETHIGGAIQVLKHEGLNGFQSLFAGKFDTLIKGITSIYFLIALVGFVIFFAIVYKSLRTVWIDNIVKDKWLYIAWIGGLLMAFMCLIFNDTGYISACIIIAGLTLMTFESFPTSVISKP